LWVELTEVCPGWRILAAISKTLLKNHDSPYNSRETNEWNSVAKENSLEPRPQIFVIALFEVRGTLITGYYKLAASD
jgi:hypothetical protein